MHHIALYLLSNNQPITDRDMAFTVLPESSMCVPAFSTCPELSFSEGYSIVHLKAVGNHSISFVPISYLFLLLAIYFQTWNYQALKGSLLCAKLLITFCPMLGFLPSVPISHQNNIHRNVFLVNTCSCKLASTRLRTPRNVWFHTVTMKNDSSEPPQKLPSPPSDKQHPPQSESSPIASPKDTAQDSPAALDNASDGHSLGSENRGGDNTDGNSGGGGGGGGSDGGDGEKNDDSAQPPEAPAPVSVPFLSERANDAINRAIRRVHKFMTTTIHSSSKTVRAILTEVPTPVLATIISASATIAVTRIKAAYDARAAEEARYEAREEKKLAAEGNLRRSYKELTMPLLKAAAKLADRFYLLVEADGSYAGEVEAEEHTNSSLYSAYLVASYFAAVEVLKRQQPLLDYGFPAADRILHNILGRVQGVFCANDDLMRQLQLTEQFFKPDSDHGLLKAGLFNLTPRVQSALGELLLRRTWVRDYDFLKTDEKIPERGFRSVLSFLEFSRVYAEDCNLRQWITPVVEDFTKLEKAARSSSRTDRRNNNIGARIFFVQSALIDLISFFDPLPDTRTVPQFRRRRLQISATGSGVYQRFPLSLLLLYEELSRLRDNRAPEGDPLQRLHLPFGVEAYITSPGNLGDIQGGKNSRSPCPVSQEILIVLSELGIPYKTVAIKSDSKPAWYYLLHPNNTTPVVYHDGNVLDTPNNIISYMHKRFNVHPGLASTKHLNLRPSITALTKFHRTFTRWLNDGTATKDDIETELRALDRIIGEVQGANNGSPFFGGERFSQEDTAIIPLLHRVDVAGRAIKKWGVPSECVALSRYLNSGRNVASFKNTVPDDEIIVDSYGEIVGDHNNCSARLADILE